MVHQPSMADAPKAHARNIAKLTPAEVRRIAAEAGVEPRTAAKYLRGDRVVSTCAYRVRSALEALGYARPEESP